MRCSADMGINDVKVWTDEKGAHSAVSIWVPKILRSVQLKQEHKLQC
jgi:hypothetical protein